MTYGRYLYRSIASLTTILMGGLFIIAGIYAQDLYPEANFALGMGIVILALNPIIYLLLKKKENDNTP